MYSHIQRKSPCVWFLWEYMCLVHKLFIITLGNNLLPVEICCGQLSDLIHRNKKMFVLLTISAVHLSCGVVCGDVVWRNVLFHVTNLTARENHAGRLNVLETDTPPYGDRGTWLDVDVIEACISSREIHNGSSRGF